MFRFRRTLTVAACLMAAAAMATPTAEATPPWFVTANAPSNTTVFFRGPTVGPQPRFVLTDNNTGAYLKCPDNFIGGYGITGTHNSGASLVRLNGATLAADSCVQPAAGLTFRGTGSGPWNFNAQTYTGSNPATGVTTGRLANINISWTEPGGCTFTTAGGNQARWYNNNNSPTLRLYSGASNLFVVSASGCGSLFVVGDSVAIIAAFRWVQSSVSPVHLNG